MPDPSRVSGAPRAQARGEWGRDLHEHLAQLQLTPEREAEIVEEISQHLDDRYQELVAAGTNEIDARRQAIAELSQGGGLTRRMQALSQAHTAPPIVQGQPTRRLMRGAWQDIVYAARTIRRQPGFALTIVVTLALGIAVNMTAFTIVNGAVLRPLPFQDSDELVQLNVKNVADARSQDSELSYLEFQEWRAATQTLEYVVGTDERGVDISGDGRPARRVAAAFVSWDTFAMLPQPPAIGRDFQESDDRVGAAPVAIIGWSLWQSRYGGDPAIVGRAIRVNGVPSTIVGVMPENFGFLYRIEFWLPLAALPERDRTARSARVLDGFARLRSGATIEQATAELSGIAASPGRTLSRHEPGHRTFRHGTWDRGPICRSADCSARRGRFRAAHRVRKRCESPPCACGRSGARRHSPHGAGRQPLAHRAPTTG
jgi:putative ABC transport system permease protein